MLVKRETSGSPSADPGYDIAEVNLACATGLPGSERIDVSAYLRTLDQWAETVRRETDCISAQFWQHAEQFGNSWAYFRILEMVTVLQRDLGIRYNEFYKARQLSFGRHFDPRLLDGDDFFKDSRNLFIHGIIETKEGTCSSLPPFFIAIGRRLGYPLKLVATAGHLFARWDDPGGERFNIECTSEGLNCWPDEYYLLWPFRVRPEDVTLCRFLKSQTPQEELAGFMSQRALCLQDNGHLKEVAYVYALSSSLAPDNRLLASALVWALNRWGEKLESQCPPNFPALELRLPARQFPSLPHDLERQLIFLNVMEDLLEDPEKNRDWWEPMRQSPTERPAHVPNNFRVHFVAPQHSLLKGTALSIFRRLDHVQSSCRQIPFQGSDQV